MKAAALIESVARFQALIDGNKRTAWTLMVLMLWINGYRHDFSTDAAFDLVVGVAAGDVSLEVSAAVAGRCRWSESPEVTKMVCGQCPHFQLQSGLYIGRTASNSACFRGFPVFSGPGRQFESHLGHSISPRQRGFALRC